MTSENKISTVEFEQFKRNYQEKYIPKNLSKKQKERWLSEVYIAKDGRKLMISGGGRLLLWWTEVQGGWNKSMKNAAKRGNAEQYNEILKFRWREKLLGLNLLKELPKKYIDSVMEHE
jgi:hypothetical protein